MKSVRTSKAMFSDRSGDNKMTAGLGGLRGLVGAAGLGGAASILLYNNLGVESLTDYMYIDIFLVFITCTYIVHIYIFIIYI